MNASLSVAARMSALAGLALMSWACDAKKSSTPLSPNVAGPIAGVSISIPEPVHPINGSEVVNTEPLRLVFNHSSSSGERPLWYVVELAADTAFTNKLYVNGRVQPVSGSQTTVIPDAKLNADVTYFWRVKADDGANASEFSAAATFDFVAPVVIDPPVPLSPVNGETTATNTPTLAVTNGKVEGRAGTVWYRYQVSRDPAFANIVVSTDVARDGSGRTDYPSAALPTGTLLFWRVIGTNGAVTGPPSAVQTFRTPTPTAPAPSPTPIPGATAGCINGVLADPRAYFFSLIGRKEGDPAPDWHAVAMASGIPSGIQAGMVPGQPLPPSASHFGLTLQVDSGGTFRGRVLLPTNTPNHSGWYFRDVDILDSPTAPFRWAWHEHSGPAYVPRPCS